MVADPLAVLAVGLATGQMPDDLLAAWSSYGDPVVAMWNSSQDPLAMVDLLEVLGVIGTSSPEHLEFDLLAQYALEYPAHPRGLMEHAIKLARNGHAHGHAAESLREELDDATAEAPGLFWIPIHVARQLIADTMEHHSVGSEVRTLAALESGGGPFPPIVAHHLRQGFAPITAEAVYAAANRLARSSETSRAPARRGGEQAVLHNPSRAKRRR